MTGLKARSLASAFAVSAISAMAFIAPGTASAMKPCTGANITGNGSSLQANAQQVVWAPAFNAGCSNTNEQVTYVSTGSGPGLASWWVGESLTEFLGFGPANQFVGTDEPPNSKQEGEIVKKGPGAKVLSIPLLQAAVALPIHLPKGCLAASGKKGKVKRLSLSDATLQGIFDHTIRTWEGVPGLVNAPGETCEKSAAIERVVRTEGSGTTSIIKKFMFQTNKGEIIPGKNWTQLAEENDNTVWPEEGVNLERQKKGSGITAYVATHAGSIGYSNLNEARTAAFTPPPSGTGGEGTAVFWPLLQEKGAKYSDPSTDGETDAAANANCAGEKYVSLNAAGKQAKFPPESTEDTWNEVTASNVQKKSYALCGFTYDLSSNKFSDFLGSDASNEPTVGGEETIKNYLEFVLSPTEQSALNGKDFLGLPTGKKGGNVLVIAQKGVALIGF